MKFDEKYFADFKFTQEQIRRNVNNAVKDFRLSQEKREKLSANYFGGSYCNDLMTFIAFSFTGS